MPDPPSSTIMGISLRWRRRALPGGAGTHEEPFQGLHSARVGSRRALLGADHRGKARRGRARSTRAEAAGGGGAEVPAGENPPRVCIVLAWGVAELCSARTIAGRQGEAGRAAPGRRRREVEGRSPRRGKPSQGLHSARVGSRRALLGADHRGKAWKPSQGFHFKVTRAYRCGAAGARERRRAAGLSPRDPRWPHLPGRRHKARSCC